MSIAREPEPAPRPVCEADATSSTPRTPAIEWHWSPVLGLLERFAFDDPALEATRDALFAEASRPATRRDG